MLRQSWDKCTTVYRSSILAISIKHFDENGTKINTRLTTLKYFMIWLLLIHHPNQGLVMKSQHNLMIAEH